MAHWIIDDHGFGGSYYRCSHCGEGLWDILEEIPWEEPCPCCGEDMDWDENEYFKNGVAEN